MIWIANVLLDFLVLGGMISRMREDRRRGIRIDWLRTLVICFYIIVITGIGVGLLILCLSFDRVGLGLLLFVATMGTGAVGLYFGARRIWPAVENRSP